MDKNIQNCPIYSLEAKRIISAEEAQALRVYRAVWYISNNTICKFSYPNKKFKGICLNSLKDQRQVKAVFDILDKHLSVYGVDTHNTIRKICLNKTPQTVSDIKNSDMEISSLTKKLIDLENKIKSGNYTQKTISKKMIILKRIDSLKGHDNEYVKGRESLRNCLRGLLSKINSMPNTGISASNG